MNKYIKNFPKEPSFKQKGFDGYVCNLDNGNISITYEDVYKGHEKYCTNKESTHIYYVLSGNGIFKINDNIYNIKTEDIIEIPPNTKFIFAGEMKLLLLMNPAFNPKDEIVGEENDLY